MEIEITFPEVSKINFMGLDDIKKVRSINANYICVKPLKKPMSLFIF